MTRGRMMVLAVASPATTPGTTFVDGVGDEVVYFFAFSVLLILMAVAWSSTSVDHSVFRAAVLVIERRRRSSPNRSQPTQVQVDSAATTTVDSGNSNSSSAPEASPSASAADVTDEIPACQINEKSNRAAEASAVDDHADCATAKTGESSVRPSTFEQPPGDTIVVPKDEGQIRVRLKYLNDTQRQVNARLEDQLGHFKRCHFGEELDENKVVRLIFNGQLLHRDQETLRHYGLVDNCVVHCHISSTPISAATLNRAAQTAATTTTGTGTTLLQQQQTGSGGHLTPQVELDLSRLMLPLFGVILGLIWCCRVQYRQYFNATSTFALLCITGLFVVSVVAICMPTRNHLQH